MRFNCISKSDKHFFNDWWNWFFKIWILSELAQRLICRCDRKTFKYSIVVIVVVEFIQVDDWLVWFLRYFVLLIEFEFLIVWFEFFLIDSFVFMTFSFRRDFRNAEILYWVEKLTWLNLKKKRRNVHCVISKLWRTCTKVRENDRITNITRHVIRQSNRYSTLTSRIFQFANACN